MVWIYYAVDAELIKRVNAPQETFQHPRDVRLQLVQDQKDEADDDLMGMTVSEFTRRTAEWCGIAAASASALQDVCPVPGRTHTNKKMFQNFICVCVSSCV